MNPHEAIAAIAPQQHSEQRKFYQALATLSGDFKGTATTLEGLSLFLEMPAERLREEAQLRGFIQHPTESLADFRRRVARAEEWQILAGSKLGLQRFLDYLGYTAYRFERVRDHVEEAWNEVNLYIKTHRTSLIEARYLDFLLAQLKPAIVVFRIYYYGNARSAHPAPRAEGDGLGYVHGQSRLAPLREIPQGRGHSHSSFVLPDFKQYDMDHYEAYDQ